MKDVLLLIGGGLCGVAVTLAVLAIWFIRNVKVWS